MDAWRGHVRASNLVGADTPSADCDAAPAEIAPDPSVCGAPAARTCGIAARHCHDRYRCLQRWCEGRAKKLLGRRAVGETGDAGRHAAGASAPRYRPRSTPGPLVMTAARPRGRSATSMNARAQEDPVQRFAQARASVRDRGSAHRTGNCGANPDRKFSNKVRPKCQDPSAMPSIARQSGLSCAT